MHCGQDWNGVACNINTSKDLSSLRDPGEAGGKCLWGEVAQLKVDMVLVWTTAPEEEGGVGEGGRGGR